MEYRSHGHPASAVGSFKQANLTLGFSTPRLLPTGGARQQHTHARFNHPQQATECIICAHGGDGAKAAPNTVEGHTHAVAAGFRCSEVDVAMTSDGHLVSVHARELSTLLPPGSQHNPADTTRLTWPEIRALHYPRGERVPLVEDVLTAVSGRVDLVVLDVKLPDDADDALVQRMVDAVGGLLARARCGGSNCTTVWSKHDAWVRAFKARHAQIPTVGVGHPLYTSVHVPSTLQLSLPIKHTSGVYRQRAGWWQ